MTEQYQLLVKHHVSAAQQEMQGTSRLLQILIHVCRQQEKKKNGVPPAGRDLSVIFLSEGLTFIEQALPRLTETQLFSFLKKNLQFRLVATLRCYFFSSPPFTRLLSQHGIFSK